MRPKPARTSAARARPLTSRRGSAASSVMHCPARARLGLDTIRTQKAGRMVAYRHCDAVAACARGERRLRFARPSRTRRAAYWLQMAHHFGEGKNVLRV